jgi:hypothetical protein
LTICACSASGFFATLAATLTGISPACTAAVTSGMASRCTAFARSTERSPTLSKAAACASGIAPIGALPPVC